MKSQTRLAIIKGKKGLTTKALTNELGISYESLTRFMNEQKIRRATLKVIENYIEANSKSVSPIFIKGTDRQGKTYNISIVPVE